MLGPARILTQPSINPSFHASLNSEPYIVRSTYLTPGLLVLLISGIVVLPVLQHFDQEWTVWLHEQGSHKLGIWMGRTMFEGKLPGASDPPVLFLLASFILYFRSWSSQASQGLIRWRPFLGFIVTTALAGSLGAVHSLKWVIGRARPYEVWGQNWPFSEWYEFGPHFINEGIYRGSFPSGHSAVILSLLTLSYIWFNGGGNRPRARSLAISWGVIVIILTVVMGIGRAISASHWLTDSLGMILPTWAVLHLLFFHLLKLPVQLEYFRSSPSLTDLPRFWELKFCGLCLPILLGMMFIIFGFRSVRFQETPWLLSMVLIGVLLVSFFWPRMKSFYSQVFQIIHGNPETENVRTK